MARAYDKKDLTNEREVRRRNILTFARSAALAMAIVCFSSFGSELASGSLFIIGGLGPAVALAIYASVVGSYNYLERERKKESERRGGKVVLGHPPNRYAFQRELKRCRKEKKAMIDRYLVGFEVDSGEPIWINDEDLCTHAAVFAKTGVGKTLWLESLMFQQMLRGRASGFTFIDAKRDMSTLADIIIMAMITGRIEDLIVVDPFDPVCCYNFVYTAQRADVKARKVLRCGLPPTSDQSTTKHYDRLAADAVYRVVRAMESLGLAWSVRDVAVALSAFSVAYPRLRGLLHERGAKQAMVELGHLAGSYRSGKGKLDALSLTDNLRGISSELHSISNSEAGEMFCAPRADLSLTDAILRGKMIYYMLPRLEEAESAARMVKVFREDLEVSIGEITSNRSYTLEDPHMVIIDEGASTFGSTWANLFELARKGRFALLFGAQSVGGLTDTSMGLSEQFYERVLANVNLKVIMRVGDNRTAMDMCEWIGKVTTTKKSISSAISTSFNAREWTKNVQVNKRSADGLREGITLAEDEEDLVSAEELKHEMSVEKGLAWFDLGDGRMRKGRALWFNSDLPPAWEGRNYLVRYESVEADEIALAEWVDEQILSVERAETEKEREGYQEDEENSLRDGEGLTGAVQPTSAKGEGDQLTGVGSSFRFNLIKARRRGGAHVKTFESKSDNNEQQAHKSDNNSLKNSIKSRSDAKVATVGLAASNVVKTDGSNVKRNMENSPLKQVSKNKGKQVKLESKR
ncbi:MAG: TraM recognition domain-containing protein [Deltaproteobacteria bacterium]|nr:TraM recognition domain-containing protein [Deltaproteobacteria bacterium]